MNRIPNIGFTNVNSDTSREMIPDINVHTHGAPLFFICSEEAIRLIPMNATMPAMKYTMMVSAKSALK